MLEYKSLLGNLEKVTTENINSTQANRNFFETMKIQLKKISNKKSSSTTASNKHIKNSFLYSNISEQHKNKIETQRKTNVRSNMNINESDDIKVITVTKLKTHLQKVKKNEEIQKKDSKNFFCTDLLLKKVDNNFLRKSNRISLIEDDLKLANFSKIMIKDFNLRGNIKGDVNKNSPKNKKRNKTAEIISKRREVEEFLEKISSPIDNRYFGMDKTNNNFNKNKNLYKTINRYKLNQNSNQSDLFILDSTSNSDHIKNKFLVNSKSQSNMMSDPKNNHLMRMMKISFNYYKLKKEKNESTKKTIHNEKIKEDFIRNINKFTKKEKKEEIDYETITINRNHLKSLSDNYSINNILDDLNINEKLIEDNIEGKDKYDEDLLSKTKMFNQNLNLQKKYGKNMNSQRKYKLNN